MTKFNLTALPCTFLSILGLIVAAAGCSGKSARVEPSATNPSDGPRIENSRAEPGTVELNRNLRAISPAVISADVRDDQAAISSVKLQFLHVPLEVQLKKMEGYAWAAELTPQQLRMLAVSGQKMTYDANIVAKSQDGRTSVSADPIEIVISTPDLDRG